LTRERMRADRFEEGFALLLISLNSRAARKSAWTRIVEALSQISLDTDVIGWFEKGSVLGLIRSVASGDPHVAAVALADNLQHDLARHVTSDQADGCSIRLHTYSPQNGSTAYVFPARGARRSLRRAVGQAAKRTVDILGSSACLIAFSPILVIVAAMVRLTSKGPILFRQERIGEGGRPFRMLKFRTMTVDADERVHQRYVEDFIRTSSTSASAANTVFKIVDDPRVTSVGHFLRRSSLDELPQFWNVLRGQMSLVGPRPPLPYEVARYKQWHRRRVLDATPGITGLWQVTGRSRTTFDEMVRLDLRYAKNHSVWTDLKILLATPRAVISGKGAH